MMLWNGNVSDKQKKKYQTVFIFLCVKISMEIRLRLVCSLGVFRRLSSTIYESTDSVYVCSSVGIVYLYMGRMHVEVNRLSIYYACFIT